MGNLCAYCQRPAKLTKEHLYPQFLAGYNGPRCLGYNAAAYKVTVGQRVIRDVCSTCNNESLGSLDGYGHRYFRANKLDQAFTEEKVAEVHYDYDLLLRWVLKISYNSFRTVDFPDDPFASLIPYILTGKNRPKSKFVKLMIELIRSHKLTDEERPRVPKEFQKTGYIPAYILCSGRMLNFPAEIPCHCRHFQLNAHRFTLFIFPYSTRPAAAERAIDLFRKQYPFAFSPDPELNCLSLPISLRDVLDVHAGPDVHPHEQYREQQYNADHS